MGIIL